MSYAEANQVKLIQAQQIADIANPNRRSCCQMAFGDSGPLVSGLALRRHEREVEEQLQGVAVRWRSLGHAVIG